MAYVERDVAAVGPVTARRGPNLVRWGAVFCGVVVALALGILFTMLWAAISHGSSNVVSQHLNWFLAGTAIGVLLVGGLLAGAMSGARGVGVGLVNGLTVWGLFVIGAVAFAIPGVIRSVTSTSGTAQTAASSAANTISNTTGIYTGNMLWPTFWALVIGAVAAGLGGILGGARQRADYVTTAGAPVAAPTTAVPTTAPPRRHDLDRDGVDDRVEAGPYPEERVVRDGDTADTADTAVYDNAGRHRRE